MAEPFDIVTVPDFNGVLALPEIKLLHATHVLQLSEHSLMTSGQFLGLGPLWIYHNILHDLQRRIRIRRSYRARMIYNMMQTFRSILVVNAQYQHIYNNRTFACVS